MGVEQSLLALLGAADDGAYEIEQSLRFDGSSYLSRTPSSAGSLTTSTFSFWVKRADWNTNQILLSASSSSTSYEYIRLSGTGKIYIICLSSNSVVWEFNSTAVFRDPSAWYHIVYVRDTSNGTAADRIRLYVNGQRITAWDTQSNPSSSASGFISSNIAHNLGRNVTDSSGEARGYLAEVNFIDGSALDHEDFGELDDNGVWRPIKYAGSYTGNSFYLKFDAADVDGDSSGLGNDWTASAGISTSGTGTDVMSDTPTNNWATLNPLWNPIQATYAEGNLKFTGGSEHSPSASSISASSGKFYFEATALSGSAAKWSLGIIDTDIPYRKQTSAINYIPGYTPNNVYSEGDAISLYDNNIYKNGSIVVSSPFSGGAVAAGDVVQMAVDIDAGKIWFGIDGTWNNGGGTEGAFNPSGHDTTFTANDNYIFHFTAESCGWEVNFGQRAFAYTPPTGFNALNTSNLPAPDIADGSDYFNTVLWTGNATARDITTGHNSNFTWIKHRNASENHNLYDILRGVGNRLESNSQDYQVNYADRLTAFNSDGFSLGTGYNNTNTTTYVGWSWAGGGSGTSNSDGSINSTVSASPSSGFSIVTWTGSQADGTVGHGLGVAPSLIIFKRYNNNGTSWPVYNPITGPSNLVQLNETTLQVSSGASFGSTPTAPTSAVFSVGDNGGTNYDNMVAYCFAEVEGYSKFGSYTGNGQNDPNCPFIYTGFKPAFLLTKCVTAASHWLMLDVARGQYYNPIGYKNSTKESLNANTSASESATGTGYEVDFLSNGFKIRATVANELNAPGETHIYAAFAENPFGGSGVTPATAR